MKRKNERGAITLFVLIACLSFITFLTTMLTVGAVKRQAQLEASKQAKDIYSRGDASTVYSEFFGEGAIPIYTFDELMKIGVVGNKITVPEEGGKIYTCAADSVYVLMNDIIGEYNGAWMMPNLSAAGGRIEVNGKEIKIKDTSKTNETIYYYYNDLNNFAFPVTEEGYSYASLQVHYDGINNTGNGHSNSITTWKDLSGNGNYGEIAGGTILEDAVHITATAGANGDSSTYVKTHNNVAINTASNLTVSMVFEMTDLNEYNATGMTTLFSTGSSSSLANYLVLHNNNANNKLYIDIGGTSARKELCDLLEYKRTYSITLVFSNNTLNFYIDGECKATITNFYPYSSNYQLWIFNALSSTHRKGTTGNIHNFKFYNRALTEAEINSNYEIDNIRFMQQDAIIPIYAVAYANNGDNTNLELVFSNTGNVDSSRDVVLNAGNITTKYFSSSSNVPWYSNRTNIKTVTFETPVQPFYMSNYFYGCSNLTTINNIQKLDTSLVKKMNCMFCECYNLENVDLSNFNTSCVTDMRAMFYNCSKLKALNLSGFDTSKVNSMNSMFYGCIKLGTGSNGNLDLSNFDTSSITENGLSSMFTNCSSLTSLNLSSFNTSGVTSMAGMFNGCSGLETINLSSFNTSNVTDMKNMFYNCSSLGRGSSGTIDLSNFNTSSVTGNGLIQMFSGCSSLTSLNLSNFNTSGATSMSSMFANCSSLESLNLSSFNTSSVTSMSSMFGNCTSLESLNLSSFNTSSVSSMSGMFTNCSSLGIASSGTIDLSNFNTSSITGNGLVNMFKNCSSLTSLDLSNFNTSGATSMEGMFNVCGGLVTLDLSSFDTSCVTSMVDMFNQCGSLVTLDLSSFNTSNVSNMNQAFSRCGSLKTIYAGDDWSTNAVTSSNYMFR